MDSLLPDGFLTGVATSGFQIEGGFNGPGQPANNWVWWERVGRVERSGVACNFWAEPEVALDRAAGLGVNTFRLSVEWARLEPVEGERDEEALARYAAILAMCEERGLEPMVTLHHFTHPSWLGEEFWLTPGAPDRFAEHVRWVLPALAPNCRRWVTLNEPNIVALTGWVQGDYPPGRRGAVSDAWAVLDNLLVAHVLAYEAVHEAQPEAMVTLNTSASSIYEMDRLLTDLLLARSLGISRPELDGWIDERRAGHDLACLPPNVFELSMRRLFAAASPFGGTATGPLPPLVRSRMRRPSPRRVVEAVYASPHERTLDAVAFDWYDPMAWRAMRVPGRPTAGGERRFDPTRPHWEIETDPGALGRWCADEQVLAPGLPSWIVENGMATRDGHPRTDGWDRPAYLRAHLRTVVETLEAGVPVGAYLHWSLMDNYEWGSYEPRFGLFGMDRSGPEGTVRWMETDASGADAAGAFRQLMEGLRRGDRSILA